MNIQKPNIQVFMSYSLGGVFVLSAVTKAVSLPVFADEMRLYLGHLKKRVYSLLQ